MKCDLCAALEADDIKALTRGKTKQVVLLCWKCLMKIPKSVANDVIAAVLEGGRRCPEAVNLAVMFATRTTPLAKTDDTFFRGWQGTGGEQFGVDHQFVQDAYLGEAKRHGVSTNGKKYMHGLAEYPGDPRAWVGTRGEMVRLLEERGWGCEQLGVKPRNDSAPPPAPAIADDVRDELVGRYLNGVPEDSITPSLIAETREMVTEKHGRPKDVPMTPLKKRRPGSKRAKKTSH